MVSQTEIPALRAALLAATALLAACSSSFSVSSAPDPTLQDAASGFVSGSLHPGIDAGALWGDADELWVIAKTARRTPATAPAQASGLLGRPAAGDAAIPLPLAHTTVAARIAGRFAAVDVTQQFRNPFASAIEAVYVFPLPEDAAVQGFVLQIGARRIRAILRERADAAAVYRAARAQGHTAALLTQERPNVFTQTVANLEPGQVVDVAIRYFHTLAWHDGWHEFVFPTVVAPRHHTATTRQPVATSHLEPGQHGDADLHLQVELDAGLPIDSLQSPSHAIEQQALAPGRVRVTTNAREGEADRDFVLRWRVAATQPQGALFTQRDRDGNGFWSLLLYPPCPPAPVARPPLELILVLDASGSMHGEPLAQARAAAHRALSLLRDDDTFLLLKFSDRSAALGPAPLAATPDAVRSARAWLDQLDGEGGTEMRHGIRAALSVPPVRGQHRVIAFLTDGLIDNESEVLGEVARGVGDARVFSVGVGSAPNRYLLSALARLGRGAVAYLGNGDDGAAVMERFLAHGCQPALTGLRVTTVAGAVDDVQPERLPDLMAGRPLLITGRVRGADPVVLRVTGSGPAGAFELTARESGGDHPDLPALWARQRIQALTEQGLVQGRDASADSRAVALEFGLVSPWTALVAVDALSAAGDAADTTVPVPLPMPRGQRHDTSVGGRK